MVVTVVFTTLLRIALAVVLLISVWRHAHWSVALSLTLCYVALEGLTLLYWLLWVLIRRVSRRQE